MKPNDITLGKQIAEKLDSFNQIHTLEGIKLIQNKQCLVEQIIDSIRRIKYITVIRDKDLSERYIDPENIIFDPLKAASWHNKRGNTDEAFWLVFLAIHFGKNKTTKWELIRNVYLGEGYNMNWTWKKTTKNPKHFREWLNKNVELLKRTGYFGNHRKYESLNALGNNGTGEAVETYIDWIGPAHNHMEFFEILKGNERNPRILFNMLYNSMKSVIRFGRTAKFDYLTMAGKLGLFDVEPDSTYMDGSTGPYAGANLLFANDINAGMSRVALEKMLIKLEKHLGLYFGMQVLEDSLCNWQKSPGAYIHFVG